MQLRMLRVAHALYGFATLVQSGRIGKGSEMPERHVLLGVSGSIAAYKAVDLASKLTQAGVAVHTVMTEAATQLVGPATFRAITGLPVSTSMFELTNPFSIEHISLSEVADLLPIAPALLLA